MNKSLYQISSEYVELMDQIEAAEGELTPEMESALAISEQEISVKAINYAMVIKQKEAESNMIADEIKRLQSIKKSADSLSARLKANIEGAMKSFGIDEIKSDPTNAQFIRLNFRKSTSVEITDEEKIPSEFKEWTPKIDKAAIKKKLAAGEEVDGAELSENRNLQIK
jgi:hypothetical protein